MEDGFLRVNLAVEPFLRLQGLKLPFSDWHRLRDFCDSKLDAEREHV